MKHNLDKIIELASEIGDDRKIAVSMMCQLSDEELILVIGKLRINLPVLAEILIVCFFINRCKPLVSSNDLWVRHQGVLKGENMRGIIVRKTLPGLPRSYNTVLNIDYVKRLGTIVLEGDYERA